MEIKEISKEINENAKAKGFWDNERNTGEMLMLVTSELAEALEADRKKDWFSKNYTAEDGAEIKDMLTKEFSKGFFEAHIKNTFEDEIADAVIRLFDIAEGHGIDLEWHIEQKLKYNLTREKKHGKLY